MTNKTLCKWNKSEPCLTQFRLGVSIGHSLSELVILQSSRESV